MKYKCKDGHVFIHPAKTVAFEFNFDEKITEPKEFMHPEDYTVTGQIEQTTCPFCGTLEYAEYVEPQPEITSVLSVDLADVDAKLKEGYVVESLYAKTATLVKREVRKEA